MMREAEARYELARLHELLSNLGVTLRAAGIRGEAAEDLVAAARQLDAQLRQVRQEAAACASS